MRTILRLFAGDVRRLAGSIATIVIVIGLVAVPGLFTWFNVAASWDPFSNTSRLKFAVANTDACYEGDLLPMRMCIGDQVVNELRANSQLDWTFTSEEDAIDGTKSGAYYAAVVIPKDFSKNMMTFFDTDMHHAQLDYYTNEKLNAMAPKVTGQGADTVAAQINTMFSSTITSTALRLASSLTKTLDSPQANQLISRLTGNMDTFANTLDHASQMLHAYQELTNAAGSIITSAQQVTKSANEQAQDTKKQVDSAKQGVSSAASALDITTDALSQAVSTSAQSTDAIVSNIDATFDHAQDTGADIATILRDQAATVQQQYDAYAKIRDTLVQLIGENHVIVKQLDTVLAQLKQLHDTLEGDAQHITSTADDVNAKRADIRKLANDAKTSISGLSGTFSNDLQPQFDAISADLASLNTVFTQGSSAMHNVMGTLEDTADGAQTSLHTLQTQLKTMQDKVDSGAQELRNLANRINEALQADDMSTVRKLLDKNPDVLADKLAAPVTLRRTVEFPVSSFGTALTPFYTYIPLWVGSLLAMVTLKPSVSRTIRRALEEAAMRDAMRRKARKEAKKRKATASGKAAVADKAAEAAIVETMVVPQSEQRIQQQSAQRSAKQQPVPQSKNQAKPRKYVHGWQLFIGRWLTVATIALLQATFSCGGSLLFMRIETVHPWAFMLTGWVSALVYSFMIYTFVYCFGNIGKAIGVIFLVVQISATGGAYPLDILPAFMSTLTQYLPVTHSVQMARAAIAGFYANDFWIEMGRLLLFIPPLAAFALIFGKPLAIYNRWYLANIDKAKVIA